MYPKIDFWRFLIGLLVVSIPAALLSRAGNDQDARRYVALMFVMLLVTNYRGVEAFGNFLRRELRAGS